MVKRRFFTARWFSVICLVFMILATPLLGYALYASGCNCCIRMVSIKKGRIKVGQDWVPLWVLQHKVDVDLSLVATIKFEMTVNDSRDEPYLQAERRFKPVFTCLELHLIDGGVERVMMSGFSKKQYIEIEKTILEVNPKIKVETSAAEYIEKYGFMY